MRGRLEFAFYLSVGVGMALASSSFMVLGGLFELTTLFWLLLAIVLAAGVCMVIACSIGELASRFPSAPAVRTYFKAAFGDRVSLGFVHLYLIFVVCIAGVESYVFALVVSAVAPGVPPLAVIVGLLFAVTSVNLLGLELPRATQMLLTGLAVAVVVCVGAGAVAVDVGVAVGASAPGPLLDGLAALPGTIALAVFLFMGFEWVTPLGLRPEAYARKVPLAMPAAIAVLALAYTLFTLGAAATVSTERLAGSATPQVAYFEHLLGDAGLYLACLVSLAAIVSTFNAGLMGGSRLILVLAREGNLPRWCATISLRTGAPLGAVLLLSALATASAVIVRLLGVELVVAVAGSAMICLIYAGYLAAARRLAKREPLEGARFRSPVPGRVQSGLAAILPLLGLATLFSLEDHLVGPAVIAAAAIGLAYALSGWSQRHRALHAARPAAAEMARPVLHR